MPARARRIQRKAGRLGPAPHPCRYRRRPGFSPGLLKTSAQRQCTDAAFSARTTRSGASCGPTSAGGASFGRGYVRARSGPTGASCGRRSGADARCGRRGGPTRCVPDGASSCRAGDRPMCGRRGASFAHCDGPSTNIPCGASCGPTGAAGAMSGRRYVRPRTGCCCASCGPPYGRGPTRPRDGASCGSGCASCVRSYGGPSYGPTGASCGCFDGRSSCGRSDARTGRPRGCGSEQAARIYRRPRRLVSFLYSVPLARRRALQANPRRLPRSTPTRSVTS